MHDDEALAVLHEPGLSITRDPQVVLEEAHRAAKALQGVIEAKPDKIMFGGQQYLEFEDWCCVGRFYGIAPRITRTTYVEYGATKGWEAVAEAVHVPSQRVVSSAEAMCLDDEEKWRARPKYAYVYHKKSGGTSIEDPGRDELIWEKGKDGKSRPKKERLLIGDEPVPLFQLRSMAQTRAAAKAMRNALAWVVVLAGYRPTPAEELPTTSGRDPEVIEHTAAPERLTAEQLFETPGEEEVRTLKANILRGWLMLDWSIDQQVDSVKQHCHATMLDDVTEPALLNDLLIALRKAWNAKPEKRGEV